MEAVAWQRRAARMRQEGVGVVADNPSQASAPEPSTSMTNVRLSLHAVLKGHQGKSGIHPHLQSSNRRRSAELVVRPKTIPREAGDDKVQARKKLLETPCSQAPLDENR